MTKVNLYKAFFIIVVLLTPGFINLSGQDFTGESKKILESEKQALDKWINRNVWGYLNLFAADATYFDNETPLRLDGYKAMEEFIAPWDGKIYAPRYEMVNVDIKISGMVGVLTYNLYNINELNDTTALWNSTEIYKQVDGYWKIIHSHWSLVDIDK